ncbi:ATP-binding protein [Streptomyces sp. NPDC001978]|uniref:ATP-binding protein n=1 Tax=Streptomyces sp. NPDC001978 TaxID=3364627 RepID=UPI0036962C5A
MHDVNSGFEPSDHETPVAGVGGSGLVARGDVTMVGKYVAGRDLTVHLPAHPEVVPHQLPADVAEFTGREYMTGELRAWLGGPRTSSALVISAIAGRAGVGKTALAVHVAHEMKDEFPDGHLYVNLRGYEAEKRDATEVLAEFLQDLGTPGNAVPESLDARQRLYRSRLHGRRVLVVLDNAGSEDQVRPLLPGSATCAVLVTSRSALLGLEGIRRLELEVLKPEHAVALLGKISGRELTGDDAEWSRQIVELCGYLPLSVRIAGARLASRSAMPMRVLANRLADERRRLRELVAGDLDVRASFGYSYRSLNAKQRRAFRRLGLLSSLEFAAWSAAAILEIDLDAAEEQLERLVDAQLLDVARHDDVGQARYRFHDLLRLYARERFDDEPSEARAPAIAAFLDVVSYLTGQADELLWPDGSWRTKDNEQPPNAPPWLSSFDLATRDAAEWLAAERVMLVSTVGQAFDEGRYDVTWRLTTVLQRFLQVRGHLREWEQVQRTALNGAVRAGRPDIEAKILHGLGELYRDLGRWREAEDAYKRVIELCRPLGDEREVALAELSTGVVMRDQGQWLEAVACYERAMPTFRRVGDRHAEAATLRELGVAYRDQGLWEEAVACYEKAMPTFVELKDHRWVAATLRELGVVRGEQGRFEEALACFEEALPVFQSYGDQLRVAYLQREFAIVHLAQDLVQEAADELGQAQAVFEELGDRRGWALTGVVVGDVLRKQDRPADALRVYEESLSIFKSIHDHRWSDTVATRMEAS